MATERGGLSAADVSVIIPVFNHAPTLAEAIESVLGQTAPPGEVVVVDDGSTDGSGDVARRFGSAVRVLAQANSGISIARNRGIGATRGRLLASIDADDRWAPNKLEVQLEWLADDVDAVGCQVANVRDADWQITVTGARPPDALFSGTLLGALLMRREVFKRAGEFDPAYRVGEQVEWWARVVDAGVRLVTVPEPLLFRRLHTENQGIRQRAMRDDYVRAVHAVLQRRRAADQARGGSE